MRTTDVGLKQRGEVSSRQAIGELGMVLLALLASNRATREGFEPARRPEGHALAEDLPRR